MISNTNELTKDSLDSGSQNFDDPDNGFELDKLEIPKPSPESKPTTVVDVNHKTDTHSTPESEVLIEPESLNELTPVPRSKKFSKLIILLVISIGLILLFGIVGVFLIKSMQANKTAAHTEVADLGIYQAIEPIVTNLGDNRYVYIALMLRSHSEQNTQFMAFQSKVVDAVFSFLGSTDFKRHVAHGGSAKMRSVIYNELTTLLDEKYPNQVILSEVRLN